MRLMICAVGKIKNAPEALLVNDYTKRIQATGRGIGISTFAIKEIDPPKSLKSAARQEHESTAILASIPPGCTKIILDERGDALKSTEFARLIENKRDQGVGDMAFLIGGADGHSSQLLDEAEKKIAFGPATWPHMLVRAMLCEQIYRAMTILTGHPYHRA